MRFGPANGRWAKTSTARGRSARPSSRRTRFRQGATGLRIEARLNGQVMQSASTDDLVFDIATLVSTISQGITLAPGDLIVTGRPSGVGAARKPPVFMKPGDVCEVEVERIGVLRNPIAQEAA